MCTCTPAIVCSSSSFLSLRWEEQTAAWEAFVGSFRTGDPDFAKRSEEILRAEFGR